ncbi:MAG: VOC family protein [Vicinamibacterales bacterium]
MPSLDTYRKLAKQIVRWHREGNYSVGGKVRLLERYRTLTDREVLDMAMPLALAQEIVAVEAGYRDWPELRTGSHVAQRPAPADSAEIVLSPAIPIVFVRDVEAAARFYESHLGFSVDFLHGNPPFYGSVSRGDACLHLRFVHAPNFAELAGREASLILVTIEVSDVKALFAEYEARGVDIAQPLTRQAWGGLDFHVRDPDGNVLSFVQYRRNVP